MSTTRTRVTSPEQLHRGDTVRTSGGKLDYRVVRIDDATGLVATEAFTNDGRTLFRIYTRRELERGTANLFKITYTAALA